MIDIELVRRKLSRLNMYLEKLKPISQKSLEEYKSEFYLKSSAERLIQLIVECAIDINNHVVVETNNRPPEDYSVSFIRASDIALITRDLAEKLKGSAGMRNILVHEYMDIDDEKVYNALSLAIKDYKEYLKQVEEFLEKLEK
ncbi:MAG: DUF86 domain-containing protein [Candidatus Omnitrophica bacterium]|nr:DUF86 domain-containing protein [Candidatus Omnitrophota bacterium]MBU4468281.1 DUF86 domain-containing protein [Candidatus Omnitrophota bacterium]MCG2708586.1 DUF86 domain-containing protein [Candidatus Omnitrophota bacterium]